MASAIVFRRGRFLRVAVIALFLIPVLYLLYLLTAEDGGGGDGLGRRSGAGGGVASRRVREAPRLVDGE